MAMLIPKEWKPYKYIITIGIDFGSTNTVLAFNFREFDGKEYVLKNGYVRRIPSMFILKSDNEKNYLIKEAGDMFGKAAEKFLNAEEYNEPPIIRSNYKQDLYDYAPGSEKQKRALENTLLLFRHLQKECVEELQHNSPHFGFEECGVFCYLSTPVRAEADKLEKMKELCQKAGFTRENGFTAIKTDNGTLNEAICAVRYLTQNFLGEKCIVIEGEGGTKTIKEEVSRFINENILFPGKLQKKSKIDGPAQWAEKANYNTWNILREKAKSGKDVYILFGDLGGSTFDLCLVIWNEDPNANGGKVIRPVSFWPHAGEKNSLGSSDIDKALRDYFIDCGLADEEYTEQKWAEGIGKKKFRIFKEACNERFCEEPNAVIEKAGGLQDVCVEEGEPFLYRKSNHKITREVFENQICKDYIDQICMAVSTLFQEQNEIKKEDIDIVLLSGAGSNLYFLKDLFLGKIGSENQRIHLKKVQENPGRIYHRIMNPSECCALGALMEPGIKVACISREEYWCEVALYRMPRALRRYVLEGNKEKDNWLELSKEEGVHEIKVRLKDEIGKDLQTTYRYCCIGCGIHKIVERNSLLPVERQVEYYFDESYKMSDFSEYIIQINIIRIQAGRAEDYWIVRKSIDEEYFFRLFRVRTSLWWSPSDYWGSHDLYFHRYYKIQGKIIVKENSVMNIKLGIYGDYMNDKIVIEEHQF